MSNVIGNSHNELTNVLHRPIYHTGTAAGHFGRDDFEFPWEKTDKAADLKKAAGS